MSRTTERIARLRLEIRGLDQRAYTLAATLGDKTLTAEARQSYQAQLDGVGDQKAGKAAEIKKLQGQPTTGQLF